MTPDLINAIFEAGGAIISLLNVRRLYYDRRISGISWLPIVFFTAWGAWNIWYYDFLLQSISVRCAFCLVLVNSTWLLMLFYYSIGRRSYGNLDPYVIKRLRSPRILS